MYRQTRLADSRNASVTLSRAYAQADMASIVAVYCVQTDLESAALPEGTTNGFWHRKVFASVSLPLLMHRQPLTVSCISLLTRQGQQTIFGSQLVPG